MDVDLVRRMIDSDDVRGLGTPRHENLPEMPYPTEQEIRDVALNGGWDHFVRNTMFSGTPFAFREDPDLLVALRSHVGSGLNKADIDIAVAGSAMLGISLSPKKFPAAFHAGSDIDVIVVDDRLFDQAWHSMLTWNYPRRYKLRGADHQWAARRQDDLYWGWFRPADVRYDGLTFPDSLKPFRDLSAQWFETFQSAALISGLETRDVKGRLYRTWEHVFAYHRDGFRKLQLSLKGFNP